MTSNQISHDTKTNIPSHHSTAKQQSQLLRKMQMYSTKVNISSLRESTQLNFSTKLTISFAIAFYMTQRLVYTNQYTTRQATGIKFEAQKIKSEAQLYTQKKGTSSNMQSVSIALQ